MEWFGLEGTQSPFRSPLHPQCAAGNRAVALGVLPAQQEGPWRVPSPGVGLGDQSLGESLP